MKNIEQWIPTKFVFQGNTLVANRDYVSKVSLLIADLVAAKLQESIPAYAHGHLLDLGCGTVPLYALYTDIVDEVTCVDWTNSSHQNIHLDYEANISQPLTFLAEDSFDIIILSDVLEHIPYPLELMKEIRRILKQGGHLLMVTPFTYWEHEEPYDFNRYTRYMYEKLALDSGMGIVALEPIGDEWCVISDILSKLSKRRLARRKLLEGGLIPGVIKIGFFSMAKVPLLLIAKIVDSYARFRCRKGAAINTNQPLGYHVIFKVKCSDKTSGPVSR